MPKRIIEQINVTNANVVDQAVAALNQGGLVIFPTETTYGAGVDATNPEAVAKLLAFKSRREGKPLSIAVSDQEMARQYVDINGQAATLYQQFLPGPVTIVSKGLGRLATEVESEFGTLGVRIPDYPLVIQIVKKLGRPITATSANSSGKKRPYALQDIFDNLSKKQHDLIDLVIDAGTLPPNPPSTVIDTTLSTPVVVRAGSVNVSQTEGDVNRTGGDVSAIQTDSVSAIRTNVVELISESESETIEIAGKLILKNWNKVSSAENHAGLILGLDGPLGVGKTIFAKGVAKFLKIQQNIASPTYTYIEEYDFTRHQTRGKFFHLDMWKVDNQEIFDRLRLDQLFGPHHVIVIEWFNQVKSFWSARDYPPVIQVEMADNRPRRLLRIREKWLSQKIQNQANQNRASDEN